MCVCMSGGGGREGVCEGERERESCENITRIIFWFNYDLGKELLCTPSSTRPRFELINSRS